LIQNLFILKYDSKVFQIKKLPLKLPQSIYNFILLFLNIFRGGFLNENILVQIIILKVFQIKKLPLKLPQSIYNLKFKFEFERPLGILMMPFHPINWNVPRT
jgi:hypothetical protein